MTYIIQNLHWFVLLIGALIFFHELGHFLVAKACGVKVLRFSLGFGPRLFGFRRGDTEYQVSALPLGGYVKMLGDVPGSSVAPEEEARAFGSKPLWQRSAIVVAGPLFNFILAFLVYIFMFTGARTFVDTKLGLVSRGQPAWEAGLRPGDQILSVNGEAITEWSELREAIGSRPGQTLRLTFRRHGEERTIAISPAARQEEDLFNELQTRGRIGVSPHYIQPVIAIVDSESPAAHAGLQTNDVIQSVNGKPVAAWHELREEVANTPPGEPVRLTAKRGEETVTVEVTPGPWPAGLDPALFSAADVYPLDAGTAPGADTALAQAAEPRAADAQAAEPRAADAQAAEPRADAPPADRSVVADASAPVEPEAAPPVGYTGLVNKDTVIEEITPDTPAEKAGLQVGDRLLALHITRPDGKEGRRAIGSWAIDLEAFSGVDARSEFTLHVQRDRSVVVHTFQLEERETQDELKNTYTTYVFGAKNDPTVSNRAYQFERDVGLLEGIVSAAQRTAFDTTLISKGLAMLVGGRLPMDTMGGPIMMFVIAEKTAKQGLEPFLAMMAMISVNLGLLNLLPIPVLDGGHLMFFAIEAVRRRPPSLRTREIAQVVGLAILLLLMVIAFKNDILRYVLG